VGRFLGKPSLRRAPLNGASERGLGAWGKISARDARLRGSALAKKAQLERNLIHESHPAPEHPFGRIMDFCRRCGRLLKTGLQPIFGPKPTDLATYEGIQVLVGATWISFEFANLRFSAGLKHPANRPFFARGHRMLQSLPIY
jgi:hypothetical protein